MGDPMHHLNFALDARWETTKFVDMVDCYAHCAHKSEQMHPLFAHTASNGLGLHIS